MKKLVLLLLCLFFGCALNAQQDIRFGILPAVNLNKKINSNWSFNTRIESRQRFILDEMNQIDSKTYVYELTDFSVITSRKIGLNNRLSIGYLVRFEDGNYTHRSIQQFTVVRSYQAFRLAHRFMSDQTFSTQEKPEFRLRYRATAEIPLNGQTLDPKEFYLKINVEKIHSLQNHIYDLELRFVPLLGYDFNRKIKAEVGIDYRVNQFVSSATRNRFWLACNLFWDL